MVFPTMPEPMMIDVADLAFTYPRAADPAIKGLSFAVGRGEIFGFLGPSGAGKSTTQKVLIGLLRASEGSVAVLGRAPRDWGADYYERIGVSFETPNHFLKLTATENLAYFAALYAGPTRAPRDLLELVGLGADGGLRVSQFSKGMKARLSIARSLLHEPELLFWDEPTAGLDPVNARRIKDLALARKAAGRTIFLTTHDMTLADELCDRVAFLVDGQIALIDAPGELKLRHGQRQVRVEYRLDGRAEHRDFPLDGLGDDAGFLGLLRSGGVRTIHTQEATLEDIFIRATGRGLS
nr:ABC transporter ATP-binding protein [Tautonia plasticadhaerens]